MLDEVEPRLKTLRYEKSHWDDAIHFYRESERRQWSAYSMAILDRVRHAAFPPSSPHLPHVHILDLHKEGFIKPHIDSVRYCGDVVAGLSLLSDSIMRLRYDEDRDGLIVDFLLPRRSLYKLGAFGRYKFTHEILAEAESTFQDQKVQRDRRISIICRDPPKPENRQDADEIRLRPIE